MDGLGRFSTRHTVRATSGSASSRASADYDFGSGSGFPRVLVQSDVSGDIPMRAVGRAVFLRGVRGVRGVLRFCLEPLQVNVEKTVSSSYDYDVEASPRTGTERGGVNAPVYR